MSVTKEEARGDQVAVEFKAENRKYVHCQYLLFVIPNTNKSSSRFKMIRYLLLSNKKKNFLITIQTL